MTKTETRIAAGKLTSAIQKEWGKELGELYAEKSESVMHKSHDLLCNTIQDIRLVLDGRTVSEFLGEEWIRNHPGVKHYVDTLQALLSED